MQKKCHRDGSEFLIQNRAEVLRFRAHNWVWPCMHKWHENFRLCATFEIRAAGTRSGRRRRAAAIYWVPVTLRIYYFHFKKNYLSEIQS